MNQLDSIKEKTYGPESAGQKRPAHEQVYQALRLQILYGDLVPGQSVTIQGLTASLGVGMTPVREAIRRLISDGALVFQDNRRVNVPLLSDVDIEEITYVRKALESELSRRATSGVAARDIDHLECLNRQLDRTIVDGDVGGYLRLNYAFHEALYSYASAPILSDLADRLWLRVGPSLRVVCGRFGTQSLPDRHKDIVVALRTQDAERVALATEQDIEQVMELMATALIPD